MNFSQFAAPTVPKSGAALMPDQVDSLGEGLWELASRALGALHPDLREGTSVCFAIVALVLLISVLKLLPGSGEKLGDFAGTLGIGSLLLRSGNSLIRLAASTIDEVSAYGNLLLPVMTSALAAQGGVTASTALYAGTAFFDTVLCSLLNRLMIPAVYIFLILCLGSAAMGEPVLKKLAGLTRWASLWVLKIILYGFTGYMGITGVVSGTTDAAALKAAKLTISGAVPVVGGILAEASEAVLVGAGVVRSAAGIYGILSIFALFAGPFLKIGCHYLLIRFTGAVCEVFGVKSCASLISDFSDAMGLLLAMTGSVCLLQLISTECFLRGVG
jgi:stage III sporulation protein AE